MSYKIAIVGATGNVGHEVLEILHERKFPISELIPLASARSAGKEVSFGDSNVKVRNLADFDFKGVDIVFSAAGSGVSKEFAPKAAKHAVVIDKTSLFRMEPDIPLIVPEVNPQALADHTKRNIIAVPNCSTIQMVVALKPLHDAAKIKRVVVATYQSVSGTGKAAMDELFNQTKGVYMNATPEPSVYPKQIAFNLIPQIDVFMDDGMTKEEWKMVAETKKILDPSIKVCASCVRVPVFISHSEMVNVELERELSADDARALWRKAKGVTLVDTESELNYITPIEAQGEDAVFISRVREDASVENGLNFWCVSDNLRKGAALNAVQIAELLVKEKKAKST
ncbi:MAG: aspartate-semialdehyde dehydrogenase [Alphaproteobacteria bacterium]|nr:aspartate-semialdehyde dehydrogenase [Alphaproteobacteria bacterium]